MARDTSTHTMIGRVLGNDFQIISFLGKGGMGSVFVAYQRSLKRKVAIKILPTLHLSEEELKRFEREIEAMSTLSHSNIVGIYYRGRYGDPPTLYYAMELLEGGSLKDYIQRYTKLRPAETVRLIRPVAEALAFAHAQGFIHRDIKPSNLLLHRNYKILKIADFGIAKHTSEPTITESQSMLGTFFYAAPEQMQWFEDANGKSTEPIVTDARADQYSLGVVLYEVLSGHLPYPGSDFLSLMRSMVNPPIPLDLSEYGGVGKDIEWIVSKMIEKSPEKRFLNDEALIEALNAIEVQTSSFVSTRIQTAKEDTQNEPYQSYITQLAKKEAMNSPTRIQKRHKRVMLSASVFIFLVFAFILVIIAIRVQQYFADQAKLQKMVTEILNEKQKNGEKGTKDPDSKNPQNKTSIPVPIILKTQYDIPPPEGAIPSVLLTSKKNREVESIKTGKLLLPGDYSLSVALQGYYCREDGQNINIPERKDSAFLIELKLIAKERQITPWILNGNEKEKIFPLSFAINGKPYCEPCLLKPGKYNFQMEFKEYSPVDQMVVVPPGEASFSLNILLTPLLKINISLPSPVFQMDEIEYPVEVVIDKKVSLSDKQIDIQKREGNYFITAFIPSETSTISLQCGYYYVEKGKEAIQRIKEWEQIDIAKLIVHCQKLGVQKLSFLSSLISKEKSKLQKVPKEQIKLLEDYLEKEKEVCSSGDQNLIKDILLQLKLLDEAERQKYYESVAFEETRKKEKVNPFEERQNLWLALQKQYPKGYYSQLIEERILYWKKAEEYETRIKESVRDCFISLQEKQKIRNLEKDLDPVDVAELKERLEKYVKQLNCGQSLEQMLR